MKLVIAMFSLLGCGSQGPSDAETTSRAQGALAPFKKSLKETLLSELSKSTVAAVEVCSKRAPELASEASKNGVRVGRSSERLRNPENTPPTWLDPVMQELSRTPAEPVASRVVDLGGGRRGYAEAIRIEGPCLLCHGATIAPEVEAKISESYPSDQARGYALGDFRGVFWAELEPVSP